MKKVLLLAGDYAEDYEMMLPFQILQFAGYEPVCVAPGKKSGEKIRTAVHDFLGDDTYREYEGHRFLLNGDFDTINPADFSGLYLTGGRAPEYLRLNEKVLDLVRWFFREERPVAAICHGIQILTAAEVAAGYFMTCYPAVSPEVKAAGGFYLEVPMDKSVVDRHLCTSPAWPGVANLMQCFTGLMGRGQERCAYKIGKNLYSVSISKNAPDFREVSLEGYLEAAGPDGRLRLKVERYSDYPCHRVLTCSALGGGGNES